MTEESLWEFSTALYARPGVEEACLALQDRHGLDVNLVLFALWLGASGRGAGFPAAALGLAASWGVTAVGPLRGVRRRLKQDTRTGAQALRAQVKAVELAAERLLQERLAALVPAPRFQKEGRPKEGGWRGPVEAARRLETYVVLAGRAPILPSRLLTALLAAAFPTAGTSALREAVRRLSDEAP